MILPQVVILFLTFGLSYCEYVNDWNKDFDFKCPEGSYINYIYSEHHDYYEDRKWNFRCTGSEVIKDCLTSYYVNKNHRDLYFTCPGDGVLTGVSSQRSIYHEDRIFKFSCCTFQGRHPSDQCVETGNRIDSKLEISLPEGHIFKSVHSSYGIYFADRWWQFSYCPLES